MTSLQRIASTRVDNNMFSMHQRKKLIKFQKGDIAALIIARIMHKSMMICIFLDKLYPTFCNSIINVNPLRIFIALIKREKHSRLMTDLSSVKHY